MSKKQKCQCYNNTKPCNNKTIEGTLFCQDHQNCKGSPLSGSEPLYEPEKYNNDPAIYKSHNCYSYGMNVIDDKLVQFCRKNDGKNCRSRFHQPGALHGDRFALNASERRKCPVVEKLMKSDIPQISKTSFYSECPRGMSKIALVVDEGEDYHYYRQDADGMWSHKDGSNKVKRYDANKVPIFNPETASRNYTPQGSDLNYEDFCGFYCVPRSSEVHLGQGGGKERKERKERKKRKTRRQSGGSYTAPSYQVAGLSWKDHRRRTRRSN
jgi:hypothetical protein